MDLFEKSSPGLGVYSDVEIRAQLASTMASYPEYWAGVQRTQTEADYTFEFRLDGLLHTIFAGLDGCGMNTCGFALSPKDDPLCEGLSGIEIGLAREVCACLGRPELVEAAIRAAEVHGWEPSDGEEKHSDAMFARLRAAHKVWLGEGLAGRSTELEALEGLLASAAAIIEGLRGGGGMILSPAPAAEDEAYHKENGERWYPSSDPDGVLAQADVGGSLRYVWTRRWDAKDALAASVAGHVAAVGEAKALDMELPRASRRGAKPGM